MTKSIIQPEAFNFTKLDECNRYWVSILYIKDGGADTQPTLT